MCRIGKLGIETDGIVPVNAPVGLERPPPRSRCPVNNAERPFRLKNVELENIARTSAMSNPDVVSGLPRRKRNAPIARKPFTTKIQNPRLIVLKVV